MYKRESGHKKIVTFVGTSLLDKLLKFHANDENLRSDVEKLREEDMKLKKVPAQNLRDKYSIEVNRIEKALEKFIEEVLKGGKALKLSEICAELKSIERIITELQNRGVESFDIILLQSDTLLGEIVGNYVENLVIQRDLKVVSDIRRETVRRFRVSNWVDFKEGVREVFKILAGYASAYEENGEVYEGYWENLVINITSGYKAAISYLTILGQVFNCEIYYIFEDSDVLLKIPPLPLKVDYDVFREYLKLFVDMDKKGILSLKDYNEDISSVSNLLEYSADEDDLDDDEYFKLNLFGEILWERFKSNYPYVYLSEIAWKEYQDLEKTQRGNVIESVRRIINNCLNNGPTETCNHQIDSGDKKLPEGFRVFKNVSNNIRILYKVEQPDKKPILYVGLFDVKAHNSGNEYVEYFHENAEKVNDTTKYKLCLINGGELECIE